MGMRMNVISKLGDSAIYYTGDATGEPRNRACRPRAVALEPQLGNRGAGDLAAWGRRGVLVPAGETPMRIPRPVFSCALTPSPSPRGSEKNTGKKASRVRARLLRREVLAQSTCEALLENVGKERSSSGKQLESR